MPPSVQSSPSSGLIYGLTAMGEGHGFKAELRRGLGERGGDTRSSSLAWWCRLCRAVSSSHLALFTKGKFRRTLLKTPEDGCKRGPSELAALFLWYAQKMWKRGNNPDVSLRGAIDLST